MPRAPRPKRSPKAETAVIADLAPVPSLSHTLKLPEVLDLKAATPLTASLLAMRGTDVMLDASAVQRVGGQCLQVLLSARSTWTADGTSLEVTSASPEFVEGLAQLGISAAQFGKSVDLEINS